MLSRVSTEIQIIPPIPLIPESLIPGPEIEEPDPIDEPYLPDDPGDEPE